MPLSAAQAIAQAEAEGLELVRADNTTGFVGVSKDTRKELPKPYRTLLKRGGKQQNLWAS